MANQKIIIEHREQYYEVYIEARAMPVPMKSWSRKCNSITEVLKGVEDLLNFLPGLLKYPEEVEEEIKKLQID